MKRLFSRVNPRVYGKSLAQRNLYTQYTNHDTPGQVEGVPISCTGANETKTKLVPGEIRQMPLTPPISLSMAAYGWNLVF